MCVCCYILGGIVALAGLGGLYYFYRIVKGLREMRF